MIERRRLMTRPMTVGVAMLTCGLVGVEPRAEADTGRAAIRADRLVTPTTMARQDEFPAIGCDAAGQVWVAWVSYDGERDAVLVAKVEDAHRPDAIVLSAEAGDYWRPAMSADGEGRLWVTWSQNDNGNWDIWGRSLSGGKWSQAVRFTENPANDICQTLAADGAGRLWMAWQAVVDRNYEVMLARVTADGLRATVNVSRHPANDWEPAVAAAGDGRIFVAWDRYRNGSYDVLVSTFKDGKPSDAIAVASTANYEAHAVLAVDGRDRLWVAWDRGGTRWGHHGKPRRRIHAVREVQIRCLDGDRLFVPDEDLSTALPETFRMWGELPELVVDGTGRLWLILRHLTDLTPKKRRKGNRPQQARGIWNPYAICYADGRWSEPFKLPQSNGRNDMRVATCVDRAGRVRVAWADDGRKPTRSYEPVNHNVRAAALIGPGGGKVELPVRPLERRAVVVTDADRSVEVPERHTLTAGGKTYMLLYGDTHRHTDISRCAMNYDGSLIDTYRYVIDVAGIDFVSISDHDQDILKHRHHRRQVPLQDYAWWRSQKYCDLFFIEGKFLPIYAYEHGGSMAKRGGHKNVLYPKRGAPCYEQDAPEALFEVLKGTEAVVIPHQLADGGSATDWTKWNRHFEPVAEIYQARGSYEFFGALPKVRVSRKGHYLWDALAMGVRIGVIASSDHGLVSSAYAGVYAAEFSRRGVFEALRARRTFGATDKLLIEFRLGENLLGEEVEAEGPPRFRVFVRGTAPLKQVQIVRDGQFVHTTRPGGPTCRFDYADLDLAPGANAYYYVRCEQQNGEWAWSSAIWVHRRK